MPLVTNLMGRMDINVRQYEEFMLTFACQNKDASLYDFASCSAEFTVYMNRRSDTVMFSLVPLLNENKIEIAIPSEYLSLPQRIYNYVLKVRYSDLTVHSWLQGSFSVGDFEARKSPSEIYLSIDDDEGAIVRVGGFTPVQPKIYRALLNQSGTNTPTASILENTLGGLQWSRAAAGLYICSFDGGFPPERTSIMIGEVGAGEGFMGMKSCFMDSPTSFMLGTLSLHSDAGMSFSMEDGQLINTTVEVSVYP